ncbi:MAG: hypothetical protein JSV62_09905 [Promethearchaeota archaeon]|nr:MAG: hypothetical protein JSV62_09905 [Candidatus Lokiarchaeota archaeon]
MSEDFLCPNCNKKLKPTVITRVFPSTYGLTCRYCRLLFNTKGEPWRNPTPVRKHYKKEASQKKNILFKINLYLSLRLEHDKTVIYVNTKPLNQCKYLLFDIPANKFENFDGINSIDEALEVYHQSMNNHYMINKSISPKTEFWGHCSNLQVWVENNYDTRLLHSNLSFPLLRKLYEVGDPIAKRVFKEEIAKRLESGYPTIVEYLIKERYVEKLSKEEVISIIDNTKFVENYLNLNNLRNINRFLDSIIWFGSNPLKHILVQVISDQNLHTHLQPLFLVINHRHRNLLSRALAEIILEIDLNNPDIGIEKINKILKNDVLKYLNNREMSYLNKKATPKFHRKSECDPNFIKLFNEVTKEYYLWRERISKIQGKK